VPPVRARQGAGIAIQRLLCVLPRREQQVMVPRMPAGPHSEAGFVHQERPATRPPSQPARYRGGFHAAMVPPRGMTTRNDTTRNDTLGLSQHSGAQRRVILAPLPAVSVPGVYDAAPRWERLVRGRE
jgi:hypothetical protein